MRCALAWPSRHLVFAEVAGAAPADGTRIDLVMPVHNEATTIASTIRSWVAVAQAQHLALRVFVAEDGSTDGTREVLERLAEEVPLELVGGGARRGYSLAVVEAIRATSAPTVCCIDSDGQCDPADLSRLLARHLSAPVVVGIRTPRRDPWPRRAMSGSVRLAVRLLHGVQLADPSCPFVVAEGEIVRSVAAADPVLAQGYWWEFHVRLHRAGITPAEVPVAHRERLAGDSRVYLPRHLARIAWTHGRGLLALRHAELP